MWGNLKFDHPPLLAPGRHNFSVSEFSTRFVFGPHGEHRFTLFLKLHDLIRQLEKWSIVCELWIDGSYLTEKEIPDDIDGTIVIYWEDYEALSDDAKSFLDDLTYKFETTKDVLDMFLVFRYPRTDPRYLIGDLQEWARQWSVQHDEKWLKGFAVLRIGVPNDGFRISA